MEDDRLAEPGRKGVPADTAQSYAPEEVFYYLSRE